MVLGLIAVSVVLAGWSLLSKGLARRRLTAPMVLVLAGLALGFSTQDVLADTLNADSAQHVAEIILAVLLFVDATDVRGGFLGANPRAALRLLFIALPLGLACSVLIGLWLLPGLPWAVLLVIACVVVPIDFAPTSTLLRDARLPERVRGLLNVEAGYNDGIVSPIFIFAVVLAADRTHAETPLDALASAVPHAVKAIIVGVLIGAGLAVAANWAQRRDLMTDQAKRVILVAAPLLAFGASVLIDGNGFVSAFVCGIAFNYLRSSDTFAAELELVDDVGFLLAAVMWFVFGLTAVLALGAGVSPATVVFCLLALTVVRILPVLVAMLGSPVSWRERLLVGWLGPRGTTSIVFGLLAFNALEGVAEHTVAQVLVVAVLGSVVLHGVSAPAAAHAYARAATKLGS
ncbi:MULTISPECIES: cation:proton antiporter [Mycolicibacterium]|uniref:NhaP-type Na+/H+ and K+/H+ antiporters with a unique C-terminal domain protein n=2 Tax=Mycolicibacterium TaxID=1866885 RepID=A0A378SY19_9MYCO|nr:MULTISPECIES: cation:proton antiporter [Mycolicibacterium]MCV7333946.1 cation:proton antiporter [Mycolicibacterium senegalense]MDR7292417.1 NhaP-type Na+/H+ or K+/H+ antiporter [Mycolicibacterium senegalense]QZA23789.1 cation:proton antiporter [Mycolicibacterium senegalense]QZH67268.1 cation:proton antiporter [Mycolicibacterium farcinogenes]CDP88364.1 Na+/H+ antiporter [Mycolicibacterium farcinogenes]